MGKWRLYIILFNIIERDREIDTFIRRVIQKMSEQKHKDKRT